MCAVDNFISMILMMTMTTMIIMRRVLIKQMNFYNIMVNLFAQVKTSDGQARVYGSASPAIVPGPALYTFTSNVSDITPLEIHVRDGTDVTLAVRNMETGGCKSNVQISVKLGNHLKTG